MEERSGKGRKVSTHLSLIVVHLAPVKIGRAASVDVEPGASLHAESKHTKRSSGALEESFGKGRNPPKLDYGTRWCR